MARSATWYIRISAANSLRNSCLLIRKSQVFDVELAVPLLRLAQQLRVRELYVKVAEGIEIEVQRTGGEPAFAEEHCEE